jgi:hypothetical protein
MPQGKARAGPSQRVDIHVSAVVELSKDVGRLGADPTRMTSIQSIHFTARIRPRLHTLNPVHAPTCCSDWVKIYAK